MRAFVLVVGVAATVPGCYLGVRAGPTLQTSDAIEYKKVGWTVGLFAGIEATFFDRLRLAVGADGSGTWQQTGQGKLKTGASGVAVKGDWTLWQRRTWSQDVEGCPRQYGGFRLRTGAGLRAGGEKADALTFTSDGMPDEVRAIDKYRAYEATVEIGGWKHNSSYFAGFGTSYATTALDGGGRVRAYAAFLQLTFAGTGPLKSANVLFSNYGAIEAEREQRAWSAVDCSSTGDPSRCEETRRDQIQAWGDRTDSEVERAKRQRAMNKCL